VIDLNRLAKLQVRLASQLHLPIDRLFSSSGLAVILAASLLGQGSSTAYTAGQSDRLPDILGRTSATPSPRPSARPIARPSTRPATQKKPAARASNRPTAARPVKKPAKPAVAIRPTARVQKPAKPTVAIRPAARPVQKPAKPTVAIRPTARVQKPAKPTVAIRPPARPVQKPAKPAVVTRSSPSPRPVPAPIAPPVAPMAGPFQDQASMTALANHLTQSGAKVYTAYWCGYCRKQVEMFGSAKLTLPVIECDPRGQNPQTDLCREKAVQGYPTWEMNGEMYRGMQEVNVLADLSGYRGPRN
jgi:hypothetical protein